MKFKIKTTISILIFLMFQSSNGMYLSERKRNEASHSIKILVGTNNKRTERGTIWKFIRGLGRYDNITGSKALRELLNKNNLPLLITNEFSWKTLKRVVDAQCVENRKAEEVYDILEREYYSFIGINNENAEDGTIWGFIRGLDNYNDITGARALQTLLAKNNLIIPITEGFSWKTLKDAVYKQNSEFGKIVTIRDVLQIQYNFLMGTNNEGMAEGTIWSFIRGLGTYNELSGARALQLVLNRYQIKLPITDRFSWKSLKKAVDEQNQEDLKAAAVYKALQQEYYSLVGTNSKYTAENTIWKFIQDIGQYNQNTGPLALKKLVSTHDYFNILLKSSKAIWKRLKVLVNNEDIEYKKAQIIYDVLMDEVEKAKAKNAELSTADYDEWFKSAISGDINKMWSLIERGIDINCRDKWGQTALSYAALHGYNRIVNLLLRKERDKVLDLLLLRRNRLGIDDDNLRLLFPRRTVIVDKNALINAAEYGSESMVTLFLNQGVKPCSEALSKAAKGGHKRIINLLINKGAKPDFNALYNAAESGYSDIFKQFINTGLDPDYCTLLQAARGGNPEIMNLVLDRVIGANLGRVLEEAVECNQSEIVKLLLNKDVKIDQLNVLEKPAEYQNIELLKLLLENGANPNFKGNKWALTKAAINGNKEIVQLLTDKIYDSDIKKESLIRAAKYGHIEIVELLLNRVENFVTKEKTLLEATKYGHIDIVKLLLKKTDNLINKREALNKACCCGHKDISELLINMKAMLYKEDLLCAARYGHKDIVELLISKGLKPDSQTMENAARGGHEEIVKMLLNMGIAPDLDCLINAVISGKTSLVSLILDKGVNPRLKDSDHYSPLSYAIKFNHVEVVKLLLDRAYNPMNICDEFNFSNKLLIAIWYGYEDIVKILLERGSYLDQEKALIEAASKGNKNIVEILLERMPHPVGQKYNCNALVYAVVNEHYDILELLLNNGADIDSSDGRTGETALSYAVKRGDLNIINLLIDKGAKIDSLVEENALKRENPTIIKFLLCKGMNPRIPNRCGMSMLDFARIRGNEQIVYILENAEHYKLQNIGITM